MRTRKLIFKGFISPPNSRLIVEPLLGRAILLRTTLTFLDGAQPRFKPSPPLCSIIRPLACLKSRGGVCYS